MLKRFFLIVGIVGFTVLGGVDHALYAQESVKRKDVKTDWSIFTEKNPTRCWVVSAPKKSVNTKNGRPVSVRRGAILFFVSFFPEENISGEVSFAGGYPFAPDKTISLKIGQSNFELFTTPKSETAWASSSTEDRKIITAMKRGIEASVVGLSQRGTVTTDNFSLLGFTAAVEEAEKLCTS